MKTINFRDNINCIRETAPERYRIILNLASTNILPFLIKDHYNYIWVHNHSTGKCYDWEEFKLPITENLVNIKTLSRSLNFDFILTTEEFKKIMRDWKDGIELIQMNNIPPYYLDLKRIKGNKRYEILEKECDCLFEVENSLSDRLWEH